MIENLCSQRTHFHETSLPYTKIPVQINFDNFSQSEAPALKQLELISYYMNDFKAILDNFKTNKPTGRGAAAKDADSSDED